MTLAEAKFKKTVEETFGRLCGELSSSASLAEVANAFLAFLNQGAQKVLVRHRKNDRTFEADYFDAWYKSLRFANPAGFEKFVKSYAGSAEGLLLLPYLGDLRNAADEMAIQWERAEMLLRDVLREHDDGSRARRPSPKAQRGSLDSPILGERDYNVARRRTALRNMMRSRRPLHALDICKEWDDLGIPVLDAWRPDISRWQQALKECSNKVHKLISVDRRKIRERTT